jgi:hypothetical protein
VVLLGKPFGTRAVERVIYRRPNGRGGGGRFTRFTRRSALGNRGDMVWVCTVLCQDSQRRGSHGERKERDAGTLLTVSLH